ncbi:MAG: 30S ribosomal protein S3 [Candidatus Gracilibacteria bacterium]|nr:30S ribosomal protein S3 [Candidatus Gracilibacteria bacterium]
MGHKVSPQAFRIPYIKNWSATWFADKKEYATQLLVDNKIRATLKTNFKDIPTGDIIISRNDKEVLVTVYTAKSALILGKDGENVTSLEVNLSKQTSAKVKLSVKEVKNPDLNAKIVGFMITNQIEKRMPYKRAIKQAISKAIEKGAKGIKVKVGGRLNGAEIARKETFKEGNIPTQTVRADIDYTTARAETVYGTIGIKVWIYKGDIFKRK